MRSHPSELFIKSLVFRGKSPSEVTDILSEYGLPGIPEEFKHDYISNIQEGLSKKTIVDFLLDSSDYKEFIQEHKIYYLLHPDSIVSACTSLLDNHSIKSDLYISLMGRLDEEDVVNFINKTYKVDATVRVLQVFKHYYFDVDLLNTSDWAYVLPEIHGADTQSLNATLVGGASAAAYRLGLDMHITIREAVQEAVTAIYATLREIRVWPASPQKVKALSDAVSSLSKAHSVINTADQELASVAKELKQFKLEKSASKTVSLNSLTLGRHSGSKKHAVT
jgi:hypothetical protein